MFRIMVVDSGNAFRQQADQLLSAAGFDALCVSDGSQALDILERKHIDLILLDAALADGSGLELLRQLRGSGFDLPVILTADAKNLPDRKAALRSGADECMLKPIDREELLLRIDSLLKRCRAVSDRRLCIGSSVLIYDDFSIEQGSKSIALPRKEFMLLYKLLSSPNKTFTRRQLMDEIWDPDTDSGEHTVTVHVNHLRKKLCKVPDFQIVTIRGLGYKAVYKRHSFI